MGVQMVDGIVIQYQLIEPNFIDFQFGLEEQAQQVEVLFILVRRVVQNVLML
jgi:hypothetical protein